MIDDMGWGGEGVGENQRRPAVYDDVSMILCYGERRVGFV